MAYNSHNVDLSTLKIGDYVLWFMGTGIVVSLTTCSVPGYNPPELSPHCISALIFVEGIPRIMALHRANIQKIIPCSPEI